MKKRMSWYWALPGAVALALVMVAVTSWASGPVARAQTATPTVTSTPLPTATVNPECQLSVSKEVDKSTVGEGGQATYTITVTNEATSGHCHDLDVTDVIPNDTNCVSASVTDDNNLTFDDSDITHTCDHDDTVEWIGTGDFGHGDEVVLKMVLELTSGANEDDKITNEACATSSSDVGGDCDSARITVGAPATATPLATATRAATAIPTVIAPPPIPTARPLATIAPPITGTGPGGGTGPLALGLGLVGVCLLLVSGAAMVKRTR